MRCIPVVVALSAIVSHLSFYSANSTLYLLPLPYTHYHTTQLFKAADNSCLATLTHGSRINRACFAKVVSPALPVAVADPTEATTSSKKGKKSSTTSSSSSSEKESNTASSIDSSGCWRLVTVCDNKTINMFDFQGKQVL